MVWALALMAVVLVSGLLATAVALQVAARQRVATAADMAALAAAQAAGEPCDEAHRMAAVNDVVLLSCVIDGPDIVVEVGRAPPAIVGRVLRLLGQQPIDIVGRARAGPPSGDLGP